MDVIAFFIPKPQAFSFLDFLYHLGTERHCLRNSIKAPFHSYKPRAVYTLDYTNNKVSFSAYVHAKCNMVVFSAGNIRSQHFFISYYICAFHHNVQ